MSLLCRAIVLFNLSQDDHFEHWYKQSSKAKKHQDSSGEEDDTQDESQDKSAAKVPDHEDADDESSEDDSDSGFQPSQPLTATTVSAVPIPEEELLDVVGVTTAPNQHTSDAMVEEVASATATSGTQVPSTQDDIQEEISPSQESNLRQSRRRRGGHTTSQPAAKRVHRSKGGAGSNRGHEE